MRLLIRILFMPAALSLLCLLTVQGVSAQGFDVEVTEVSDWRPVFGKVQSVKRALARARLSGSLVELRAEEGDSVAAGQVLARVEDEKLALEIAGVEAGIRALEAQIALAEIDLSRVLELRERGASPKTAVDQAQTALSVAEENHAAQQAQRDLLLARQAEGIVRAPEAGRILSVPVVEGMFVNPGETIATIATENFVLRTELPERHARYLEAGETVRILARGELTSAEAQSDGRIAKIYPELVAGQVVVDVEAEGLGDFFVGERVRLLIATGQRPAIVVPEVYLQQRNGVTFARLDSGAEVVVQPGVRVDGGIEVLAGLKPGDQLSAYEAVQK
ncbi:MAG: efflux RND transporter periplasmic adaptor subunit [Rhodobacteraceae bacterium]|nr:efflux RND transporter periplasmic adaptor subunit [Paracoccaceae bacterium]